MPDKMEEINNLISYAIKEGFIDDSAEDWSDAEKLNYYRKCELAEQD